MELVVPIFLIMVVSVAKVESEGHYIFTAPSKLQMGHTESLCISLLDFYEDVFVEVRLTNNGTVLESISHTFKNGKGHCLDFPVPKLEERQYGDPKDEVEVIGVGQTTDQHFRGSKHVNLVAGRHGSLFVQTDKPLYKPGQLVRFRVLAIDENFRPVVTPINVELRNPLDVKMALWSDQESEYGLLDFDFQLSKEPVMGTWSIVATLDGIKTPTTFKVEEYVLPKFEVSVTPPSYLHPWTTDIEGKVCAKYTYGKPVKGRLRVEICLDKGYYSYGRSPESSDNRACTEFTGQINGCKDFSVNSTLIGLPFNTYSIWSAKVRYNASILEDGTGVTLYGSAETSSILTTEVTIKFEDVSTYFKPGLPFSGKVVVTRPDKSPAPGEPIRLIARSYSPWMHFERNFTTDINGIFYFALPSAAAKDSFNLQATAMRYEAGAYSMPENFHKVSPSSGYHYLNPWYSRSGSFLEISTIKDTVKCGDDIPVEVTYTTPPGTKYRFHYQIFVRGNIIETGSVENDFEGSEFTETDHGAETLIRMTTLATTPRPTTPTSPATNNTSNDTTTTPPGEKPELFSAITIDQEQVESQSAEIPRIKREASMNSTHLARFKFILPLTTNMAGGGRLLVYYVREDGEVVAGNINFKAENCVDNKVEMSFADSQVHPGSPTRIDLTASPSSLCGIGVVDKSVLLLGGQNQITLNQVFEFWNQIDPLRYVYSNIDHNEVNLYCLDQLGIPEKYQEDVDERLLRLSNEWWDLPFYFKTDQVDALEAFLKVGLVTITDLDLMTRPCTISDRSKYEYVLYDELDGFRRYRLRGGATDSGPVAMMGPGIARAESAPQPTAFSSTSAKDNTVQAKEEKVRTYFPETWLWDIKKVGDDGRLTLLKSIPDTITEWVGSTVCTNVEDGLGVSSTERVRAFKPFFVSYTLPYSVIRGEEIPVPITVFNYLTDCLAIQVNLDVTKGGFDLDGEPRVTVCVCGQESVTHRFVITPNTLGNVNITVDAKSVTDAGYCSNSLVMSTEGIGVRDIITRPLLVESEGIPEEYTRSYFICPNEAEESVLQNVEMLLPDNVILDSARGYVTVIGDLMGSALNNLDSLVRMPYGCGEQNMASFTPNIYVMQYLESTGRLNPEISEKAINYMKIGYQRQLRYRHKDGSYSAFGQRDGSEGSGSSWLTAFVVKSLAQAKPYIYLDQEDLDKSISFFNSTQDSVTGCFPKIGQTSAYLKGGLEGQANSTLTAYILIALLEADTASEDPVVKGAVKCIMNDDFSDIYTTALAAYALTLVDERMPYRHKLLNRLRDAVIEEDGIQHWERKDKPQKPERHRWWWYYPARSAEVEMTAYALMALIVDQKENGIIIGQPIVQWLSRQRNAYGGFSSTQDTVVALQALAEYGSIAYSDGLDLSLTVSADGNDLMSVELADTDSLIPHRKRIDNLPTEVKISASGSGCALLQANARYNIEGETPKDPAFNLDIKMFQSVVEPKNCDRQRMQICVWFTVPAQVSNMAIIEVKMVTGWEPEENSLKELVAQPLWGIQRYEIDNNIVNFYFSEISSQKSCVYFEVIKQLEVNNTQPGRVHVYDYYETDYSVISPYEIEPQCNAYPWRPIFFSGEVARFSVSANDSLTVEDSENGGDDSSEEEEDSSEEEEDEIPRCPYCPEKQPEDLEDMVCSSQVAYKTQAGRDGEYPLKLRADFRPIKSKIEVEKFVKYTLAADCSCDILSENTKVFILGPADIFDEKSDMLKLDGRTSIIKLTKGLDKTVRNFVTQNKCK